MSALASPAEPTRLAIAELTPKPIGRSFQLAPVGLLNPLNIEWKYYQDRRHQTMAEAHTLPMYLLLPEITALLAAENNAVHHFLFNTLWHTGGRISEVLALRPGMPRPNTA